MGTAEAEAGRKRTGRRRLSHTILSATFTETASTVTSKSRPLPVGIGIPISTSDPASLIGNNLLYPALAATANLRAEASRIGFITP